MKKNNKIHISAGHTQTVKVTDVKKVRDGVSILVDNGGYITLPQYVIDAINAVNKINNK